MNNHFTTIAEQVLPSPATHLLPVLNNNPDMSSASEFSSFQHFSNEQVFKALSTLDAGKATGANNIPAKAIKSVAGDIAQVLHIHLINLFVKVNSPQCGKSLAFHHFLKEEFLQTATTIDRCLFYLV